ncbi:thymidylate synthase [Falsiroseomonas oryzae]|uniref:thymidylate synthase n=1 Tax=Falsiroseomonas oryzae TaxID=2766473 RepID=UPI0022EA5108|nr:thymidylate synthase [Roseomonas sp. MO-31]
MQHDKPARPPGIHAQTIGECWLGSIRYVLNHGQPHHDGEVGLIELLGLAVEITAPREEDPIILAHGDPAVVTRTLAKFARGASMPERPFTYGQRIFDMDGVDQLDWMVERLLRKPDTKSATINLLVTGSTAAGLPCLTTLDAKIRRGQLDLQFFFRSQNIFGRQYANLAALARLQSDLARRCNTVSGVLRGYVASAHIYAFDIDDARKLIVGAPIRIADRYHELGPRPSGA